MVARAETLTTISAPRNRLPILSTNPPGVSCKSLFL